MDQAVLVEDQLDAGMRFVETLEKTMPVLVAFWLKASEDEDWSLYVASNQFDYGNRRLAYQNVLTSAREMNSGFDPFRVNLVGLNEPIVKAVLEFYLTHPPTIPYRLHDTSIGSIAVADAYLLKGPTEDFTMPTGREVLDTIIDAEASFFRAQRRAPNKIKIPVLMAYDLAKCGRNELGDLSGRVFKDGITAFEKEGFHGMAVEIVRDTNATLQLE
jgi:hypothetical protein